MTASRDDVVAAARGVFAEADVESVLARLERYGTAPHEREKERVQLAILQLCGGSTEKLQYLVDVAKRDYRDVLAWQERGPLSEAEGERLQDEARRLIDRWGRK